jgi:hypothetical protein
MLTPLSAPHVPLRFPLLNAVGSQTTLPGSPTALRIDAGGPTARPHAAPSSLISVVPHADPRLHPRHAQPWRPRLCPRLPRHRRPSTTCVTLGLLGSHLPASTSVVTTGEGLTGGTSGQPSSDDHVGEAGLPATD